MATQTIQFTGKALWAQPWPDQVDRAFVEENDKRGGKWTVKVKLDAESVTTFRALGTKAKLTSMYDLTKGKDPDETRNIAVFNRYERHPVLGELGAPEVTGVEAGTPIGNDSDLTVTVDVYDYKFNGRPGRAVRLVSLNVDNLVEYKKPEDKPEVIGVPVD